MLFILNHQGIRQKFHKNYSLKVTVKDLVWNKSKE